MTKNMEENFENMFYMEVQNTDVSLFDNEEVNVFKTGTKEVGVKCNLYRGYGDKVPLDIEYINTLKDKNKVFPICLEVFADGIDYDVEDSLKLWIVDSARIIYLEDLPNQTKIKYLPSENLTIKIGDNKFSCSICKIVDISEEYLRFQDKNVVGVKAVYDTERNTAFYKFVIVVNNISDKEYKD